MDKILNLKSLNFLPVLIFVWILAGSCTFIPEEPFVELETETYAGDEWLGVYFSRPDNRTQNDYRGGIDEDLAFAIRDARVSVDAALYDLSLWSIRDALINAHRNGVQVRVVTESDSLDEDEIQDLVRAGIPVLGDRREGRMHNKFFVIDRQEIWTGSMNPTLYGAYRHDENLIRVQSPLFAENYTVEFEEMFVEDRFGAGSPANTPHPEMEIGGTRVEVYFSPDDQTAERLIELIQGAKDNIKIMAFTFTADNIASAVINSSRNGVDVSGVMERSQYYSNAGTKLDAFLDADLDVRLDGNPDMMHHKVIIIDDRIVITGSYNFSHSAESRNDENVVIVHDQEVASLYLEEFERVFAAAVRVQ